ncbi:hypothetical protein IAU59_005253 [Kwoniella sp. CBS 9459]
MAQSDTNHSASDATTETGSAVAASDTASVASHTSDKTVVGEGGNPDTASNVSNAETQARHSSNGPSSTWIPTRRGLDREIRLTETSGSG